jgi:hypothetical protein
VLPWLNGLTDGQREWFREHGRQMAERLLGYLDQPDVDDGAENLRRAGEDAAEYGRLASTLGLSLSQTVEGFLQFRRPFLHQLAAFAERRGLDASSTTQLLEAAEHAMDRLLMSAMAGHGVQPVTSGRGASPHAEKNR